MTFERNVNSDGSYRCKRPEKQKKTYYYFRTKSNVSNGLGFKRPVRLYCYASKRLYERHDVSTVRQNGGTGNKRKTGRTALAFQNEFTATVVDDVVNVISLGFQKDRTGPNRNRTLLTASFTSSTRDREYRNGSRSFERRLRDYCARKKVNDIRASGRGTRVSIVLETLRGLPFENDPPPHKNSAYDPGDGGSQNDTVVVKYIPYRPALCRRSVPATRSIFMTFELSHVLSFIPPAIRFTIPPSREHPLPPPAMQTTVSLDGTELLGDGI